MEGNGPEINPRIEELLNAWRTELNAPEILPYNDELVDYIKDMLNNVEVRYFWDKCDDETWTWFVMRSAVRKLM